MAILTSTAFSSPGSIVTVVDGGGRDRVDVRAARLERDARAAAGHVERVGHAHDARLDRHRVAGAAVADHGVERLRDDDGQLRVLVDPVEQHRHPVGGEEEAVLLVVGAVDRHAGVVEQARGRDHHLGVADVHPVLGDHRRLHAAAVQQPEQPQRDVDHDLDVHPGVVRHVAPVRVDLLHVPPGVEAPVGVRGLEQAPPACGCRAWERESRSSARPREVPFHKVTLEPLVDGHGRVISDLRVSVTDRCNFRCQYCMPADGLPWLDRDEVLRFEEIERLVSRDGADGRDRPPAHGRRAAGAARVPAAGVDARARGRDRGPLAHHERLPARARRRGAGRRRHHARERVDRLAPARPLLPDHPARLAAAGAARPRGDRRVPAGAADQGERRRAARLHRGGGDPVRRVRPLDLATRCASSSSCRWTATTRGRRTRC